jgi:hypothetical protein
MRRAGTRQAAAALLALVAGGCVINQPPPLLTLGDRACVPEPDLAAAHAVPFKSDSPATVTFDEKSPCLQPPDEAARLYAVFRLPTAGEPFSLAVTSQARGVGVLAPYLVLLDEQGKPVRGIAHDRFIFRGSSLYAGFRPQPGESYLLVASDPAAVGQETSGIVGNVQASAVYTGYGSFTMYTGSESTQRITRAHSGIITVSADPLPKPVSSDGKAAQP